MAYMNAELLQDTKFLYAEAPVIDLIDKNDDRTLTLGVDSSDESGENIMRHVYLKGGVLHLHVYILTTEGELQTIDSLVDNEIDARLLKPQQYTLPRATDTDFVMSMYHVGIKLDFVSFYDVENDIQPVASNFYGQLLP